MDQLYPLLQTQLESGGVARLVVTGSSMVPTLQSRRDAVCLQLPDKPLKKGDIILYKRENGQFVLHRIVSVPVDGTFFCCGDNQWEKETVSQAQVLSVVSALIRGGKTVTEDSGLPLLWAKCWVAFLPVRRPLLALRRRAGKIKRYLTHKYKGVCL